MTKPTVYYQFDSKWATHNYSAKGESKTIKSSGCGITCTAMVIASLKNKNVTPVTTAEWSMKHGYKALNQGTYYTYFVPQFKEYGIDCKRLNTSNLYGKSTSDAHTEAKKALKAGSWVIACMGVGNWTSGGHYILVYGIDDSDNVYINDPASTASNRVKNKWSLFAKQVKYLWTVTVPKTSTSKTTTTTKKAYSGTFPTLPSRGYFKKGDKGTQVKNLQKFLNWYGGYKLIVDGDFGSNTYAAVRNFQSKENLAVDGQFGKKSLEKAKTIKK